MAINLDFLRRWIGTYFHWQNLNTDKNDRPKGSILRNGRAWFKPSGYGSFGHFSLEFEWVFGGWFRWFGAHVGLFAGESNRDINVGVGLGFCAFYLILHYILPSRFGYPRHNWKHETGITIAHDGGSHGPYVSIRLHHSGADCWECGWQGWLKFWHPLDTLLGKPKYESKPLFTEHTHLSLPEGAYPVTVTLAEDSWKRPRWPRPHVVKRAEIDCPIGIPKPGKGENDWDCGEDATFGLICSASTVDEALGKLHASVMRDREYYGGPNWKPAGSKLAT
jgi:hypothetical protein